MSSDPQDLLKPLRGMYLAQLRERTETVKAFLGHCREGRATLYSRGESLPNGIVAG